ncbi:MAG: HAMP domain-containing protein [Cyanobacteria bacterium J007]|jgi:adenylate cyclase|nr:MAG: HAMP domain-containing protein [Cyanobacteria bacterium J007]
MTLRRNTLLAISITLGSLVGVLYYTSRTILLDGFTKLEEREAKQNVQRVRDAFSNYLDEFKNLNFQWGVWDETYSFIETKNRDYVTRNLGETNLLSIGANALVFLNKSGELVYGTAFDLDEKKILPLSADIAKYLQDNQSLVESYEEAIQGIVMLERGPMAIASGPILTSDGGGPSRGTLVLGRNLDAVEIQHLAELTHLDITAYRLDRGEAIGLPPKHAIDPTQIALKLSSSDREVPISVEALNPDIMAGYTVFNDIYGTPALLLQVNIPRDISKQGQTTLNTLIITLFILGIGFGILTLLLLERIILARLTHLSKDVETIGIDNDLSRRVSIPGKDELSSLASAINSMLGAIESSTEQVKIEQQKAENLLLNILPEPIADRLKLQENTIADSFAEVTVLFADIVGFTKLSSEIPAAELVRLLNEIFSRFDRLVGKHGLEKIKTIGDCYMVVSGLPVPREDHAEAIAEMALDMQAEIAKFNQKMDTSLSMRIGIHTGPVIAGVIGIKKFIYDLWGDTVNIASRMESHGIPGCIHLSEATYECLKNRDYLLKERGTIDIKGKGRMRTYLLEGRSGDRVQLSQ